MGLAKKYTSKKTHLAQCERCLNKEKVIDVAWDRVSSPKCSLCGGYLWPVSEKTRNIKFTRKSY